jgi:hypothetical protein
MMPPPDAAIPPPAASAAGYATAPGAVPAYADGSFHGHSILDGS